MKQDLKIRDFAVTIRNIVDIGKPVELERLTQEDASTVFKDILAPPSEILEVMTCVFNQVCSLSKEDILHLELPSLRIMDAPKLFFMDEKKIVDLFEAAPLHTLSLYPSLHRSGILMLNMLVRFENPQGFSVAQAIELARLNLRTVAMEIPPSLLSHMEIPEKGDRIRRVKNGKASIFVASLKDLTTELIRPLFTKYLAKKFELHPLRDRRCISSTLVCVYDTEPSCENVEKFVEVENYGKEMRGLGSLDRSYHERTDTVVNESFVHNLSVDEEIGVYTFGLSDLILFDTTFAKVVETQHCNKEWKDRDSVVMYNTSHYSCLLEWVYLEKYLIDLYSRLLSQSIAKESTTPEQMLAIQKQSMHDLIAYQSGITPYPSREEFLEKARNAHRIMDMQEKLERKRDLATDYVIQEYTLRTNKSIQLINIFISATAAFGLMQVILNIEQIHGNRLIWSIITLVLFFVMMLILWGINKIHMAKKSS